MKSKIGDKYDHLTVIGETEISGKTHRARCRCDCGREIIKSDYLLRKPTVNFKACGHKDCQYSGITNLDQPPEVIEKFKKAAAAKRVEIADRVRKVEIDQAAANRFLTMAWR